MSDQNMEAGWQVVHQACITPELRVRTQQAKP